jgi:hypothetical protein
MWRYGRNLFVPGPEAFSARRLRTREVDQRRVTRLLAVKIERLSQNLFSPKRLFLIPRIKEKPDREPRIRYLAGKIELNRPLPVVLRCEKLPLSGSSAAQSLRAAEADGAHLVLMHCVSLSSGTISCIWTLWYTL